MSTHYNRLAVSSAYSAANYLPAMLKTNKSGWLIEYYVENPQTQELSRKRIKPQRLLSRYPTKTEAKKHINNIIVALNMKLSTGWNPYVYLFNRPVLILYYIFCLFKIMPKQAEHIPHYQNNLNILYSKH